MKQKKGYKIYPFDCLRKIFYFENEGVSFRETSSFTLFQNLSGFAD